MFICALKWVSYYYTLKCFRAGMKLFAMLFPTLFAENCNIITIMQ